MPIDPSIILGVKPTQLQDPLETYGKSLALKGLMGQQQLQGIQTQQAQESLDANQRFRALFAGNASPTVQDVMAADPTKGMAYQKSQLDNKKTQSDIDLNTAHAGEFKQQAIVHAAQVHRDMLSNINDPASAAKWVQSGYDDPVLGPVLSRISSPEQGIAGIPTDPQAFQQWKNQASLGAAKFIEMNAPKITSQNLGGSEQLVSTPGLGGAPTVLSSTPRTQSPDSVASNQVAIRGQNMADARAAQTLNKDYAVAGINPDGTMRGDQSAIVDAIGQYKVAPPNGMALRNPRMQAILAQVAQKYPDFDATQYGARQSAAKAFSTGPQAQQVQSANTALNHLDTIQQLAEAQKNGNVQLFNQLANTIGAQLGQAAPTDLKAAVTMVAPEITKAVVGAGGGVEDRNKAAAALNLNYSPDQMIGSVGTIKELFGGRLSETERTYNRATGKQDFRTSFLSPAAKAVLDARDTKSGAADHPADITNLLGKYGKP